MWETATFQLLHTWKGSELLAFSADGRWVLTGDIKDSSGLDPAHSECWIWSVDSGGLHRPLQGNTSSVCAAAFNPGSTRIVTGSQDSTIRVWDARTGEQLLVLEERRVSDRWVDAVTFSGDSRIVLSHSSKKWTLVRYGSVDSDQESDPVKVWDASNGTLLASLSETRADSPRTPRSACFSLCGSYVAPMSGDGAAALWRVLRCKGHRGRSRCNPCRHLT